MSDINITKQHSVEMDALRKRVDDMVESLKQKYSIKYNWSGDTCNISGAGLKKGTVSLTNSSLTIDITLGMLAKMLKPKIEEQIEKKIGKIVA